MDLVAVAHAISDLGGWGACLVGVVTAGVGLYRRWWVPGWTFTDERDRRIRAEDQLARNIATLEGRRLGIAEGRHREALSERQHADDDHG